MIKVGGVDGAPTCSNKHSGAGREIDRAFAVLFQNGEVSWKRKPMDRRHKLGPRFLSDHHVVVFMAEKSWLTGKEFESLRSLLARLSASAASYSEAALKKWGKEGWEVTVEALRAKTTREEYESMSKEARMSTLRSREVIRSMRNAARVSD